MPVTAYIGLGSNLGDRKRNITAAIDELGRSVRVAAVSSLYCTEPVGYQEQDDFLNAVVAVETELSAEALLALCRTIEDRLGRRRTVRWGPRTIDVDILLYGAEVLAHPGLVIPHPRMTERKFVLAPLVEIAADVVHPVRNRSAAQLLAELADRHTVVRCRADGKTS